MTSQSLSLTRRSVLGAALVSVAMPRLALAQTAEGLNAGQDKTIMKIRIAFNDHDFTATSTITPQRVT